MKNKCETCGIEYEGHHRSKYCPSCKSLKLKISPTKVELVGAHEAESYTKQVGPLPAVVSGAHLGNDGTFHTDVFGTTGPCWHEYGMCSGGYELWPGWVYCNRKMVCVAGNAPRDVLDMVHDMTQRVTVNRIPMLGDYDHPASIKAREAKNA